MLCRAGLGGENDSAQNLNSMPEPKMPRAPYRVVAERGAADSTIVRRLRDAFADYCRWSIRLFCGFGKRLSSSDGLGVLGIANDASFVDVLVSWDGIFRGRQNISQFVLRRRNHRHVGNHDANR